MLHSKVERNHLQLCLKRSINGFKFKVDLRITYLETSSGASGLFNLLDICNMSDKTDK